MPLKIHYPFKYFSITQKWNNPNPVYEAAGFNFKNHNGIDAVSGYANATTVYNPRVWQVWCPVEGFRVDKVQYRADGGGHEIWMVSKEQVQMGDKLCYAYLVMCHAEKIFLKAGDEPAVGELVMMADSTGFSTGPHTHIGLYRVQKNGAGWIYLDQNDANGSYDPAVFFTGKYSVDLASYTTLFKGVMRYYTYLSTGV